ncbi:MAG TPA: NAD(P)-dependent oxidoreductase [Tepidisphaeraceae bacterium]|nr:NAD(P)-dependent oxidoreductase [Tepidisphaeraceae bacterium]
MLPNSHRTLLVTGAAGKVGRQFIHRILNDPAFSRTTVRALCHNRMLEPADRLEVIAGDMSSRDDVRAAVDGITHVLHLATCKETPETIMDVAVKGMFWLLEECRSSKQFRQLILVGGDAGMGHFFYPHPVPVTERQKHAAYPGCYALSKVLEEVMLEQYYIQYNLNGCCLRAPWIMEKDDFKQTLSFGPDVFGGPRWRDYVSSEEADRYEAAGAIPVMLDAAGEAVKRNFVHIEDLIDAILAAIDCPKARQQLFNICMDEPIDYREVGSYLKATRGLATVDIKTEFHGTWLDNAKAKFLLGWKPRYDMKRLIDSAWEYRRSPQDPRKVWYPG